MRTNCKARAIPYRTRKGYSKAYAKQNGFTNLRWYTDDGYSGANFQRPGFQSMLADIEAGKVGTVIVKDMSRLGRNYLQVGFYTEMLFPQKGVRFIAVNDNVYSANGGMDNDFTPLRNLFNEWLVRDTSKKIKAVKRSKGMSGKPVIPAAVSESRPQARLLHLRQLQETHQRLYGALYPHRPTDRRCPLQSPASDRIRRQA